MHGDGTAAVEGSVTASRRRYAAVRCSRPGYSRLILSLLQALEELQAHGGGRLGRLCIGARFGGLLCARIRRQHCPLRLSGPRRLPRSLGALRWGPWCRGPGGEARGGVGRRLLVAGCWSLVEPARRALPSTTASASRASQIVASHATGPRARRCRCKHA